MSSYYFRTFGYGVKISELQNIVVSKVVELIQTAPQYAKVFNEWLGSCGVEKLTLDDLKEFDDDYCLGLATILSEVIGECEDIWLTPCGDLDDETYLLYTPRYPWYMNRQDKSLKESDIQSLLTKYLSKITDEEITIDYYDPEDGG